MTPRHVATVARFGPDRRLTGLVGVAALVAAGLAATAGDAPGRLLLVLAALVLAGYAVGDLVFWPRLAADIRGLRIRTPLARADLAWADIDAVRADVRTRLGLRTTTLEVDAGALLVVFSKRSLGADPEDVADLVRAFAPRPR